MLKISVIMPVYNGEKYLRGAIESILNQTYSDFEFIIINDCSTDSTEGIINSYNDQRIVYLKNEKNMGVAATLNRGLDIAKGEYIARMDADDISMPDRFLEQVKYMDAHKNIGVLGTYIVIFGDDVAERKYTCSHKNEELKAGLFFKSSLAHPTVMIRNSVLNEHALKYKEEYNGFEDFALWWEIIKYSNIAMLPKILVKYRQHSSQVTKKYKSYYDNYYKEFFNKRLDIFRIEHNLIAEELLYKYCISPDNVFSEKEINELVEIFRKLVIKNNEIRIFNSTAFKKNITSALCRIIGNSNLSEKTKNEIMYKAVNYNVFLNRVYFKNLIHRILKKLGD